MRKFCLSMIVWVIVSLMTLAPQIDAKDYRPLITGKFEQGQRLYLSEDEGIGKDYYFREGWLKFKQKLTSKSYYYFKIRYADNDFVDYNQYNSSTIDLMGNYTYQFSKPLRFKTEVGLREKKYPLAGEKSYIEISTSFELFLKPWEKDDILCRLSLQQENYQQKTKNNLLSNFFIEWERDISDGFSLYSQYKLSTQNYNDQESLKNKMRHSLSIGFEYQL
ncbi:MAG: hypothetical protein KAX49_00755 [Halanaerobiales bacterium]|nr:hypothetical protein [Halanaerobiales bacterium]